MDAEGVDVISRGEGFGLSERFDRIGNEAAGLATGDELAVGLVATIDEALANDLVAGGGGGAGESTFRQGEDFGGRKDGGDAGDDRFGDCFISLRLIVERAVRLDVLKGGELSEGSDLAGDGA